MVEIAPGIRCFQASSKKDSAKIYLQDEEIIGAIIDDFSAINPKVVLFTKHSGRVEVSWHLYHEALVQYMEGKDVTDAST